MCTQDYFIKKLPFEDKVLSSAVIAEASSKKEFKQSSLIYLLDRFPVLLPPDCSKDTLLEEYNLFLATDTTCCVAEHTDDTWTVIGQMTDSCESVLFAKLGAFMKGLLTIPHSNTHCERIFSCVRRNRTDQRASFGDGTLEALLVVKNMSEPHKLSDDIRGRAHCKYCVNIAFCGCHMHFSHTPASPYAKWSI